jgi:hypothetical protein
MDKLPKAEVELRKRAVFEAMSPRRQKHIEKMGYDRWDPFQEPNDPIDIRRDSTKRTTQQLVREFLQSIEGDHYTNSFGQGAFDIAMGIVNKDERYRGMFEFACWYRDLVEREKQSSG